MDLGFAEVFDRVEKHLGTKMTKVLIFVAWLTVMSFCVKSIFEYLVKPVIDAGPSVYDTLGIIDAIRIVATVLVTFTLGAILLEFNRMKLLRGEYEETTGSAHELMDEIRAHRFESTGDLSQMMEDVDATISRTDRLLEQANSVNLASRMVLEEVYTIASRKEVMTDEQLADLRAFLDSEVGDAPSMAIQGPHAA